MNQGLAFAMNRKDGKAGWRVTSTGQIARAETIVDKVRRRLRPFWYPLTPPRNVDAIDVIVADRFRLLLDPMLRSGELTDLKVAVGAHPSNSKRRKIEAVIFDADQHPHQLTEFVRIP